MANRYGYMTNVNHTIGDNGRTLPVSQDNPLPINISSTSGTNVVSSNNSSTTPLAAGATYTGTIDDVLNYTNINIAIYADANSAEGGLEFQFSANGTDWITSDAYTYRSNGRKTYSIQRITKWFRVKYTNGPVDQTAFELCVLYNATGTIASSHRIGDLISNEDDAGLVKAVLSGETPTGDQINIGASTEGGIKADVVTPTGSLPVSQLTTLHDGKILSRLFPEINEIVGTGTGSFQTNKYNMAVASGEWLVHQSRRFLPYYSGKPQKVELTFDHFAPETDVVKRVGYFSSNTVSPYATDYDGFYLESSNGTISFVIMRNGVEIINIPYTSWSGYNVMSNYQTLSEWDNFTVIEFNFLWLGGAYIEIRVVTQAGFTTAHKFVYAGSSQDVFIESPNQPVRYEIRSTTGTGSFRYICNQVATSGSIQESAISRSVNTGATAFTLSSVGTTYPVLAIRKQSTNRVNPVRISTANLFVQSLDRVLWSLQVNPTLSAGLTYAPVPASSVEYASGNGTITVTSPGIVVASDYLTRNDRIPSAIFANNYLSWLSGSITGTQDEYVLCATPQTVNVSISGSIVTLEG